MKKCFAFALCVGLYATTAVWADGVVQGHARIEKVKGNSSQGYVELYESNIFYSYDNGTYTGLMCRLGACNGTTHDGLYTFVGPAGNGSMYVMQPHFFIRPFVTRPATIYNNQARTINPEVPTDYSCAFGEKSGDWGESPWASWQQSWYQTFIATGTSITGLSVKLAGSDANTVMFEILKDNGDPDIRQWPVINANYPRAKSPCTSCDLWAKWRSDMVPTIPNHRYAFKITGLGGNVAPYRRIEDNQGYPLGEAYDVNGNAENFDLYGYVFSDNDDTIIPYISMYNHNDLAGWAGKWAQTFKATSNRLAAVDMYYAGGDTWDKQITFKVRQGGVNGAQVGPTKIAQGAYAATSSGFVGVSYSEDEVVLVPGQTYAIEMSGTGFNPYKMSNSGDSYANGQAYKEGSAQNVDLSMTIMEYRSSFVPPSIELNTTLIEHEFKAMSTLPNDTFTIRNAGGDTLEYTITDNSQLLHVSPTTGTSQFETDDITIVYDNEELLPVGEFTFNISVSDPSADNSPQNITVRLNVINPTLRGDFDLDGDVDMEDFGHFQTCYTGSGQQVINTNCYDSMFDSDEDVDTEDMAIFTACFTGPNIQGDPFCKP